MLKIASHKFSRAANLLVAGFFIVVSTGLAAPAQAAVAPWSAQEMLRSQQKVELQPGESIDYTIGFKNTGSQSWRPEGLRFVSVYTYGPKYRRSVFQDNSWLNARQPARLLDNEVKPGAIGRFKFTLYAPLDVGSYSETFALASEDTAWIGGGQFTVDITVAKKTAAVANTYLERPLATGQKALKLLVSDQTLRLEAGTSKDFRVGLKNVGRLPWQVGGAAPVRILAETQSNAYSFRDASWQGDAAATLTSDTQPGGLALFSLKLTAGANAGSYVARFSLASGNEAIEGGIIELPIEITGGANFGTYPMSPTSEDGVLYDPDISGFGPRGPLVRIGLYYDTRPVVITAAGAYDLIDGLDQPVRQLSGATSITFDFTNRIYTLRNGDWTWTTSYHVHFRPLDPASTIFEVLSYENRPTWDTTINFNKFRGTLEVFYTKATDRLWVIEELPVEDYLRGLAETSNGSPYEYQKALVTAARTYALLVKMIGGKYPTQYFDLMPTAGDQVYKGYASELVRPNVVRAVEETRGLAVTYNNEVVTTPYFSRSDGRSRDWMEVWGYKVHPWLVSVPCPYDVGKTLWGHGVGMSAEDALGRAKDGADWKSILKYYYTGTQIKRVY